MSKDLILMDGLGIAPSELVPEGTIAIMLKGGDVHMVPVADLRGSMKTLGHENIEGLTMAPADFEKLRAVVERREREGRDEGEAPDPPEPPQES